MGVDRCLEMLQPAFEVAGFKGLFHMQLQVLLQGATLIDTGLEEDRFPKITNQWQMLGQVYVGGFQKKRAQQAVLQHSFVEVVH